MLLRHLLARLFDYGWFYILAVFGSLMLPLEVEREALVIGALAVPLGFIPLEMVLLKKWQTTPGKKIFGIAVSSPTWKESFKNALSFQSAAFPTALSRFSIQRYLIKITLVCLSASALFLGPRMAEVAVQYEQRVTAVGWVPYLSPEGEFQVQFPKKPAHTSQTYEVPDGGSVDLQEVKADHKAEFSVSYLQLPRKWKLFSAATLLKGALKVVLEHKPEAQLVAQKRVQHKNYPAVDFRLKEGENWIEGRLILVGNTLYQLSVVYFPETPVEAQHETFLNSFEITASS